MNIPQGIGSLIRVLPEGYEQACFDTGAIQRKRDIKSPDDLMMLNMFHLMTGCSLIEISEVSKILNIGEISDVGFMKRFKNCNNWFKWIIDKTISEGLITYKKPEKLKDYRILAVDASDVSEKGRSGRIYRLHFALNIMNMEAALYNITTNKTGEKLSNFDFKKEDLIIADRGYASSAGIEYCNEKRVQFIIRVNANNIRFCDKDGKRFDIKDKVIGREKGEQYVYIQTQKENLIPARICFKKKDEKSIEKTKKKIHRVQTRNRFKMSDKTKMFHEYIVIVTSLDKEKITAEEALELYRYRWQAELYFKRLKSILDYGELPKKKEESIFSWLNGKLMIALLLEKIISKTVFSPEAEKESYEEYLERTQIF